jgi:hypothetical protein
MRGSRGERRAAQLSFPVPVSTVKETNRLVRFITEKIFFSALKVASLPRKNCGRYTTF